MPEFSHISWDANKPENFSRTTILSDINPPQQLESPLISHDLIPGQHVNDLLFLTCRHVVSGQMLSFSSEIERWPSPVNTCHCEGIISPRWFSCSQLWWRWWRCVMSGFDLLPTSHNSTSHRYYIDEAFSQWTATYHNCRGRRLGLSNVENLSTVLQSYCLTV